MKLPDPTDDGWRKIVIRLIVSAAIQRSEEYRTRHSNCRKRGSERKGSNSRSKKTNGNAERFRTNFSSCRRESCYHSERFVPGDAYGSCSENSTVCVC